MSTVSSDCPGISIRITGVRSSICTTSTVRPGILRARHQLSISLTARAMWPFSRHFGSNIGDLFGIAMYSTRVGMMLSSHTLRTKSVVLVLSRVAELACVCDMAGPGCRDGPGRILRRRASLVRIRPRAAGDEPGRAGPPRAAAGVRLLPRCVADHGTRRLFWQEIETGCPSRDAIDGYRH